MMTTRFEPEMTRRFGVEEVHNVCFEPDGWPGKGPCIGLGIPECEFQYCVIGADGEPAAMVNRPQRNQKLKYCFASSAKWRPRSEASSCFLATPSNKPNAWQCWLQSDCLVISALRSSACMRPNRERGAI